MTTHRALILLAALLAGSWSMNAACARGARRRRSPSGRPALTTSCWRRRSRPASPAGKVEVNEVFWYGCGHCYALDPALESWKAEKPAYVEFVRVPVIWGPMHRQHAKLYYTLQALRRPDLHSKVFDAIHQQGLQLAARR